MHDELLRQLMAGAVPDTELTAAEATARARSALLGEAERNLKVGRYELGARIAHGGYGVVYEAHDPQLRRDVAIKIIPAQRGGRQRSLERLLREARAMAQVSHPGVVPVHDVGVLPGDAGIFIVMDHVRGQTLAQWLTQEPRPPLTEILAMFQRAGAGLAAAHQAGLVHRDFKPQNVLVGEGRVCVTDFGLSAAYDTPLPGVSAVDLEAIEFGEDDVTLTLTRAAGTPAYMAPEQYLEGSADPRVDQYAFCAALYHGLTGQTPFRGPSAEALAAAKREPPRWPAGNTTPRRVRALIERGLSPDPQQRFASMQALLRQLQPSAQWRRPGWWAAGIAAAGAAAVLIAAPSRADAYCADGRPRPQWDEAQSLPIRTAVLGTDVPFAGDVWTKVDAALRSYVGTWTGQHTAACRVLDDAPPDDANAELPLICLDQARRDFHILLGLLAEADGEVVSHAMAAVESLPPPGSCDAPAPWLAHGPRGTGTLDDRLRRANLLNLTGQFREGLEEAKQALEHGTAMKDVRAQAEANYLIAHLELALGFSAPDAHPRLVRATELATEAGDDALAAKAMIRLIRVSGTAHVDNEDANAWIARANEAVAALPNEPEVAARLASAKAHVWAARGRFADARAEAERAVKLRREALGSEHPSVGHALDELGVILARTGDTNEGLKVLREAAAVTEKALGDTHPQFGGVLDHIGSVKRHAGDYAGSREDHERALRLWIAALGEDHPSVARAHNNLGVLADIRGDRSDARRHYEAALKVWRARGDGRNPRIALVLSNVGALATMQGDLDAGEQAYREAIAILRETYGPNHPQLMEPTQNLGILLERRGNLEEADRLLTEAVAMATKSYGPEHPALADPLTNLVRVASRRGQRERALEFGKRVIAMLESSVGDKHPKLATALCTYASALRRMDRWPAAHDAFDRAIGILEGSPETAQFLGMCLNGLGDAYVAEGAHVDAIATYARALNIFERSEVDPATLADARFKLAKAIEAGGGKRNRTLRLARAAATVLEPLGSDYAEQLRAIEAWIARHPESTARP